MEAKIESTMSFAKKTGDKMLLEIIVTGNPDEVVSKILKSIARHEDLMDGIAVNQLYFGGTSIDDIITRTTQKTMETIHDNLETMQHEMRGPMSRPNID